MRDKPGDGLQTSPFCVETKNVTPPIPRGFGDKTPRENVTSEMIRGADSRPHRFDWKRNVQIEMSGEHGVHRSDLALCSAQPCLLRSGLVRVLFVFVFHEC